MTQEVRDKRRRLAMDVPTPIHEKLKEVALHYNCTVTAYVLRAIVDKLKIEEQYK